MIFLSDLRELFCLSENHRNMLTLPYKTERPERFLAQLIGLIHKYRFWEMVSRVIDQGFCKVVKATLKPKT